MTESPPEDSDGSRMRLEPDAVHEADDGVYLDCPQCGATVSVVRIVTTGRCSGHLDDLAHAEDDTGREECNAKLSLELLWEA